MNLQWIICRWPLKQIIFIGFQPAVKAKDKAPNNYGSERKGKVSLWLCNIKSKVARNWEVEGQEKKETGEQRYKHRITQLIQRGTKKSSVQKWLLWPSKLRLRKNKQKKILLFISNTSLLTKAKQTIRISSHLLYTLNMYNLYVNYTSIKPENKPTSIPWAFPLNNILTWTKGDLKWKSTASSQIYGYGGIDAQEKASKDIGQLIHVFTLRKWIIGGFSLSSLHLYILSLLFFFFLQREHLKNTKKSFILENQNFF